MGKSYITLHQGELASLLELGGSDKIVFKAKLVSLDKLIHVDLGSNLEFQVYLKCTNTYLSCLTSLPAKTVILLQLILYNHDNNK